MKSLLVGWDETGAPDEASLLSPESSMVPSSGPVFNDGPIEASTKPPNSDREELEIIDLDEPPVDVERNDHRARVDALMAA